MTPRKPPPNDADKKTQAEEDEDELQRIEFEFGKGKAKFDLRGQHGQILIRALAFLTISLGIAVCLWCLALLIRAAGTTWQSILGYSIWLTLYLFSAWWPRS